MLNHLVENAIDFLNKSISELQLSPKYSVIHFHTAIELFLKVRLMAEHWSLIVSPKKEPDWGEFEQGKFVSVTLEEAAKRMDKIVQSGLSDKQLDAFRIVSKHRNQMVHFYHKAETSEADERRVQGIVKEQLKAWYFLHDLLLRQWKTIFQDWMDPLAQLDVKLRQHHEFLKVVFEELKPTIKKLTDDGYWFHECPSCGFAAERHDIEIKELYVSECLVCGLKENCIQVPCPDCVDGTLLFHGEPSAKCPKCSEEFEGNILIDQFVDDSEAYLAVKDGGFYPFPLNCGECSGYETVVEVDDRQYLCTDCFAIADSFDTCEWCNDESTNLSDNTLWSGCDFCDGRAGWDND